MISQSGVRDGVRGASSHDVSSRSGTSCRLSFPPACDWRTEVVKYFKRRSLTRISSGNSFFPFLLSLASSPSLPLSSPACVVLMSSRSSHLLPLSRTLPLLLLRLLPRLPLSLPHSRSTFHRRSCRVSRALERRGIRGGGRLASRREEESSRAAEN